MPLQHQLTCRAKHILGNKKKLRDKYSYINNSQKHHYKSYSINCIYGEFLNRACGEQGVVTGLRATNPFLS